MFFFFFNVQNYMDFIFIETYHIYIYIKAEFQLRVGLEL
jgi:hypothetical protein